MNSNLLYNDLGYCNVVHHLGTDMDIVRAARTSYDKVFEQRKDGEDKKLLTYLYKNRHTSPFEQVNITFAIKMPIFVMRQFVRHRTFRLNEMSARYCEMPDEFYIPTKWRKQSKSSKQSSEEADLNHDRCSELASTACQFAYGAYRSLIEEGVATEMARIVLPVSIMTKIVVNVDLHNLMHFLRLRLHPHAQEEIRVLAEVMGQAAESLFPWTMEAFNRFYVEIKDRYDENGD